MEQQPKNKGGRPRKEGRVHKYIVPPHIEKLIEKWGIEYVWNAAYTYATLMVEN